MVNLSFATLKLNNNPSKSPIGSYQGNSKAHNYTIEIKNVTNDIRYGHFVFKTAFTILYLYDIFSDDESRNFMTLNGYKLHTDSSSNLTIATYYSEDMVQKWPNVQHRDKLSKEGNNPESVLLILNKIKSIYKVDKLPVMIIIKKEKNGQDRYCIVDLSKYKKENLLDIFKNVMDTINYHCEEDFSTIEQRIKGFDVKITESNRFIFNTYDYIQDLSNAQSKHIPYNLDYLAKELDISTRTLHSRRSKRDFRRNELLYIAIRFKIPVEDLNMLLRENNHGEIRIDGRDGVILSGLYDQLSIDEVEQQLLDKGYQGIKIEKKENPRK